MPVTVSIVEDNDQLRGTLARVIGGAEGFRCLSQYANAEAALESLPRDRPDVVLMDINLPGMNGVECIRKLRLLIPSVHIVMLTVYEDPDQIYDALSAGAMGYLLKQTPAAELLDAIRDVHGGGAPMSSQIARKVVQAFQSVPVADETEGLSPREREVLDYLAQGYLIKEIGDKLGIGIGTVRTYVGRIYEKLHVHSRAQAVAKMRNSPASNRPSPK
jgi:DNA-binding NarL/FixJ family response regulator